MPCLEQFTTNLTDGVLSVDKFYCLYYYINLNITSTQGCDFKTVAEVLLLIFSYM